MSGYEFWSEMRDLTRLRDTLVRKCLDGKLINTDEEALLRSWVTNARRLADPSEHTLKWCENIETALEANQKANQINRISDFLLNNEKLANYDYSLSQQSRNNLRRGLGVSEYDDVYPVLAARLYKEGVRL